MGDDVDVDSVVNENCNDKTKDVKREHQDITCCHQSVRRAPQAPGLCFFKGQGNPLSMRGFQWARRVPHAFPEAQFSISIGDFLIFASDTSTTPQIVELRLSGENSKYPMSRIPRSRMLGGTFGKSAIDTWCVRLFRLTTFCSKECPSDTQTMLGGGPVISALGLNPKLELILGQFMQ